MEPEVSRGTLSSLWQAHTGRLIDKWAHYLPIYERHFERFRNTPVRVLEIGVSHGGSLQLWKAYFGWQSEISGLDIDERCLEYADEPLGIRVECGDQGNAAFMARFAMECGPWDIIIDDGSHVLKDQETSFSRLWGHMPSGGVYLIEDCHNGWPRCRFIAPYFTCYEWVMVVEKPSLEWQPTPIQRIVTGTPSRHLNHDEIAAYGPLNAQYLHPHL